MAMGWDNGEDTTSLEQALDRATESYALAIRESLGSARAGARDGEALDRTTALALVRTPTFIVGPLRWKGVEVSDDFLRYAARVAQGEQLGPYRGQVLARANVHFPWSTALSRPLDGPTEPTLARARRRRRSRWLLGWARGAGALVLCVLLVGFGAAAMAGGQADPRASLAFDASRPALAPAPLPASDPTPARATAPDPATPGEIRSKTPAPRHRRRAESVAQEPPVAVPAAVTAAPTAIAAPTTATAATPEVMPAPAGAVRTIVGSTTLPPLEALEHAAESPLWLDAPPF